MARQTGIYILFMIVRFAIETAISTKVSLDRHNSLELSNNQSTYLLLNYCVLSMLAA